MEIFIVNTNVKLYTLKKVYCCNPVISKRHWNAQQVGSVELQLNKLAHLESFALGY